MKKLLLLLFLAIGFTAVADEVKFDFVTNSYGFERESGNSTNYLENGAIIKDGAVSIELKNNAEGTTNWRFWKDGLRATKAVVGQMTIKAEGATITGVTCAIANSATNIAVNGADAEAVAKGATFTWTGSADEAVLVFTQTGTTAVASMTVTYAAGAEAEKKDAELSFSAAAVTVTANKLEEFIAPTLTNPNNLTVTYASSEEKVAKVAADGKVTLTGEAGTAKITASFAGNDEFRAGEASYIITVKEAPKSVTSVAATLELAANTEFIVDYDLTVAYAKGSNVFAYTADKEFIQLYGSNSYEVGDIIAKGWVGQYALYNNGAVPEIKPVGAFPAAAYKSEVAFVPAEVAAADVKAELVNHVIVVKGVTFATGITAGKTTTNGTVGQTTLAFYNSFELAAQEAGIYNVTAVVQIYSGKVQLYPTAYELVEGGETPEPVEPEVTEVKTVAETIALADNTKVKIGYALTVAFSNAGNIFTCDEAGNFIQVFAKDKKNSYKSGDVIPAGWEATYKLYNGVTPELEIASVDGLPEATEGTFTPKAVAFADITVAMVNNVVKIEKVVFDVATPSSKTNFTGKIGETEVALRNNYALASVEAGTYNVTVVITLFKATGATEYAPSLYVVNFEPVKTDGINEIEAEAAEAVYYNLQGVEVKNPANGVYIVRRGTKVTKEFIR